MAVPARTNVVLFTSFFVFAGVVSLLKPLMLDVVPSIQQTAALALGRLAEQSHDLAEAVVEENILSELICSHMGEQNVSRGWGEYKGQLYMNNNERNQIILRNNWVGGYTQCVLCCFRCNRCWCNSLYLSLGSDS